MYSRYGNVSRACAGDALNALITTSPAVWSRDRDTAALHTDGTSAREKVSTIEGGLAFTVTVIMPILLAGAGFGSVLRLLYPAIACGTAGVFYARNSPWYVGQCVWLFCATPLVRRLIDAQAGWDPSNPALLSPYLACAFAAWGALQLLAGMPRIAKLTLPFYLILGCIAYGLVLAAFDNRVLTGSVDAMKWSAGPLMALHVLQRGESRAAIRRVLIFSLLVAVPLMAIYGIAQYINPQPWDADWMVNAQSLGLDSIGVPKPFELRVFSTMNSPGSLAAMLMFGTLAAFHRRLSIMLPVIILAVVALLLTQYRAIWAGTLLGLMYLAIQGSSRGSIRLLILALTMIAAVSLTALVPQMQEAVFSRFQSLNDLSTDASGADRLHQYEMFVSGRDDNIIVGQGLAIDSASRRVVDSGIIEIFSVYGILVGSIFFFGVAWAIGLAFLRGPAAEMSLCRAAAIALFCQVPFGSVFVGESGFCVWVFLGLAAAASDRFVENSREVSGYVLKT